MPSTLFANMPELSAFHATTGMPVNVFMCMKYCVDAVDRPYSSHDATNTIDTTCNIYASSCVETVS